MNEREALLELLGCQGWSLFTKLVEELWGDHGTLAQITAHPEQVRELLAARMAIAQIMARPYVRLDEIKAEGEDKA